MTASPDALISCAGLSKIYEGGVAALTGLTLDIRPGQTAGLLGENGAGKSTLLRLIMGFQFPTDGEIRVFGEREVRRAHPRIGYVPERQFAEPQLSGERYLRYLAELSGLWGAVARQRVAAVLAQVDLSDAGSRRIGTYSKGMLQRLGIAGALLHDPLAAMCS